MLLTYASLVFTAAALLGLNDAVRIGRYRIDGWRDDSNKITIYRNIFYARASRLEHARLKRVESNYNATSSVSIICQQISTLPIIYYLKRQSILSPFLSKAVEREDCLTLDIYVPHSISSSAKANFSTYVFVHGSGEFKHGSSSLYDGRHLAKSHQAIVIFVNYRLGLNGFYPDEERADLAFEDVLVATQWVSEYAPYFGGNRSAITLILESYSQYAYPHLLRFGQSYFTNILFLGTVSQPAKLPKSRAARELDSILFRANCKSSDDAEREVTCLKQLDTSHWTDLMMNTKNVFITNDIKVESKSSKQAMIITGANCLIPSAFQMQSFDQFVNDLINIQHHSEESFMVESNKLLRDVIRVILGRKYTKKVADSLYNLMFKDLSSADSIFRQFQFVIEEYFCLTQTYEQLKMVAQHFDLVYLMYLKGKPGWSDYPTYINVTNDDLLPFLLGLPVELVNYDIRPYSDTIQQSDFLQTVLVTNIMSNFAKSQAPTYTNVQPISRDENGLMWGDVLLLGPRRLSFTRVKAITSFARFWGDIREEGGGNGGGDVTTPRSGPGNPGGKSGQTTGQNSTISSSNQMFRIGSFTMSKTKGEIITSLLIAFCSILLFLFLVLLAFICYLTTSRTKRRDLTSRSGRDGFGHSNPNSDIASTAL